MQSAEEVSPEELAVMKRIFSGTDVSINPEIARRLVERGLLVRDEASFRLTPQGRMVMVRNR